MRTYSELNKAQTINKFIEIVKELFKQFKSGECSTQPLCRKLTIELQDGTVYKIQSIYKQNTLCTKGSQRLEQSQTVDLINLMGDEIEMVGHLSTIKISHNTAVFYYLTDIN